MPHPVTNFLKSSTTSLEVKVSNLKKSAAIVVRRQASPRRSGSTSPRSDRLPSYASSTEDFVELSHAPPAQQLPPVGRMTETSRQSSYSSETHRETRRDQPPHHRRISFPSLHIGRSSKESHSHSHVHAALDWKLESPPVIFYGDAENSTGAIVSGQLFLNVTQEDGLDMEYVNATLSIRSSHKKPFAPHCQECAAQVTGLRKWTFLERPLLLAKGQHAFPFSVLLEGHHPTTMDGPLSSVSYHFKAEAATKADTNGPTQPPLRFEKVLGVKRSLPVPDLPHHSVRVFPPTDIKATVFYPQVIHPIGRNTLNLRLDGLAKQNARPNMIEYWKLTKLSWRLEETAKDLAPACAKHSGATTDQDQEQPAPKTVQRTDTRIIGDKVMFAGWKSHYGAISDTLVEMDLDYQLNRHTRFNCNTRSPGGSQVTHQLILEMVVSQEVAPAGKPSRSTPTGIGRILRMQFNTVLTEHPGIGISWDNESPPIYQDVPPSPPGYCDIRAAEDAMEHLDGVIANGSIHRQSVDVGAATEQSNGSDR